MDVTERTRQAGSTATRRQVLAGGVLSAAALASPAMAVGRTLANTPHVFSMDYAPHFGTFENLAGPDLVAQLEFAREQGFTAWEDNRLARRAPDEQRRIAAAMERLGTRMGIFVAHAVDWQNPTLTAGDPDLVAAFLSQIESAIELAKRFNARWMTVVPGLYSPKLYLEYQSANVIDALRRAADLLEPHGLTMVIEPLNHYANHPNLFLSTVPQAFMLCRAVDSPACKILFDLYHQQIQQGNIIPNLDAAWSEVGYIQIGDTPGRVEPMAGEMNYRRIFQHIRSKGYAGILGMEHRASMPGAAGEQALIEAYRQADAG